MKEIKYLKRIADKTLDLRLEAFGAVQIAYTREDGVKIIPIGCLRD